MKISIAIEGLSTGANVSLKTTTTNPYDEARRALLRLVRLVEEADGSQWYTIFLGSTATKIQAIKVVRELTKLDLKSAKDVVDQALATGSPLAKLQTKEQAEAWLQAMRGVAEIEIRASR